MLIYFQIIENHVYLFGDLIDRTRSFYCFHIVILDDDPQRRCFLIHCPNKNMNFRIKTETITAEADATACTSMHMSDFWARYKLIKSDHILFRLFPPWQAWFLCRDSGYFWDGVATKLWQSDMPAILRIACINSSKDKKNCSLSNVSLWNRSNLLNLPIFYFFNFYLSSVVFFTCYSILIGLMRKSNGRKRNKEFMRIVANCSHEFKDIFSR